MKPGMLKRRLAFQSPTSASDGYGGTTEGWTDEFTTFARVRPLKGGETVLADRLSGRQPVVISVRQSEATLRIATEWRAVDQFSGAVYQVKSPPANMDERERFLDILAESGVAA